MKQLKHLFSLALVAMTLFSFVACDDTDDETQAPTFESISLSRLVVESSDTITLKLNIKDKGKNAYIWRCEFGWVNKYDPTDKYSLALTKETYPITLDNPVYVFKAPKNPGTYVVSFTPKISYIAGKNLYSDGPTLTSTLVVKAKGSEENPEF